MTLLSLKMSPEERQLCCVIPVPMCLSRPFGYAVGIWAACTAVSVNGNATNALGGKQAGSVEVPSVKRLFFAGPGKVRSVTCSLQVKAGRAILSLPHVAIS